MTIAIGYHCWKGVVVAADTLVIIGPDVQEGSKLEVKWTKHGSFAFANSSNDGNATATLIGGILHDVEGAPSIRTYRDLGLIIKRCMTEWRNGYANSPPETQLILGVMLKRQQPKLFLCEPPNTFLEKDDYCAVGAGGSVTDPLYKTLFGNNGGEHTDVQTILRRICYLIYRAKEDSWMCGKRTHAAIVHKDDLEPTTVTPTDLHTAERASSELDFLLSTAAVFALQDDDSVIDKNAAGLGEMLKGFADVRKTQFHDIFGDIIKL